MRHLVFATSGLHCAFFNHGRLPKSQMCQVTRDAYQTTKHLDQEGSHRTHVPCAPSEKLFSPSDPNYWPVSSLAPKFNTNPSY